MNEDRTYYTRDEICEILSLCLSQVSRLFEVEGFPVVKNVKTHPAQYEVDKEKFHQWLADNMGKTVPVRSREK